MTQYNKLQTLKSGDLVVYGNKPHFLCLQIVNLDTKYHKDRIIAFGYSYTQKRIVQSEFNLMFLSNVISS